MPRKLTKIVRNRRGRWGIKPRLIILHTTEGHNRAGVSDLTGLASWFNGSLKISSHYGVDSEGNSIRMVPDDEVAYHAGWVNQWSLGIEQVGFASTKKKNWVINYHRGLYRVAAILADWHIKYGIPLKFSRFKGVCGHKNVSGPGGHWDPGPDYPLEYVLTWARLIVARRRFNPRKNMRWQRAKIRNLEKQVARVQRRYGRKKPDTRPW